MRFTAGGATDWLGFQFRMMGDGCFWYDCGAFIKMQKNGSLSINRDITSLATGTVTGSLDRWRHVRLVSETNGTIRVFVDGELITEVISNNNISSEHFGFLSEGASVEIDNFRIYPNDATASSIGYDPEYLDVISTTNSNGNTTRVLRDEYRNALETVNDNGLVVSSVSQKLSRNNTTGNFDPSQPNASYSAAFPNGNALYNSGFELGDGGVPDYWYKDSGGGFTVLAGGEFKRDKNRGYSGNYALLFSESSGYNFNQILHDPHFLWTGKKYYLRFWVKVDGGGTANPTITATLGKEGSTQEITATKTLTDANWTLFEADLSSGNDWDAPFASSYLSISSDIAMELLFDDFYLTEIEYEDQSGPKHSGAYSVSFSNGTGQVMQEQIWNGDSYSSNYTVSHAEYDNLGRSWRSWRPYNYDTGNKFDASFSSHAQSYYGTGSSVRLYTQKEYYAEPLSRVKSVLPAGTGVEKIEYSYGSELFAGIQFSKTSVTDLGNIVSSSISDYAGHTIRSTTAVGTSEEITSSNIYDPYTRIAESRPPHYFDPPTASVADDWVSTSKTDFLGRTIETTSPDAGTSKIKYDEQGRLRFSQSAQQAYDGKVSYTSYDSFGRPLVSGEAAAIFSSLDGNQSYSFENQFENFVALTKYDETPSANDFPWTFFGSQMTGIKSNNSLKTVSSEAYRMDGITNPSMYHFEWQVVIYSYDFSGRVEKKWILTQDKPSLRTEITYTYNDAGQIIKQHTKVGTSQNFYHFYVYDQQGRVSEVSTNTTSTRPNYPTITYNYDAEGKLIFRSTVGLSMASSGFEYDEQGRLSLITTGSGNFEESLSYNTSSQISNVDIINNAGAYNEYSYHFTYDDLGRLEEANYSSVLDLPPHNSHDVKNIGYDKHGNIHDLERYGASSQLIDNLTYSYMAGTNKLSKVDHTGTNHTEGYDDRHQAIEVSGDDLDMIISQVHYNSEYDDNYGAAEYIELTNISGNTMNLKNWQLEDLSNPDQRYKVLDDFYVAHGQRVVFANDQQSLYSTHYRYGYDFNLRDNSGQGALVLRLANDSGNTNVLALRNPAGTVVDYVSWGGNSYGGYTWNKNQGNDETVALHRNKVVCT
ncbi:MAG: lamin tail domain-containing protein, partial [Balneolaceae bacterium]